MNDAPGWASPGSSEPEQPQGDRDRDASAPDAAPEGSGAPTPSGWSPQQPPPGGPTGWSAPGDQGGWGGQQGWSPPAAPGGWHGHSGWHYAHAAKPGVIPLRPLGVGEILDGAVSTMRAHWRPVLGIALGIAVLTELVATVVTGVWFNDMSSLAALQDNQNPTMDELADAFGTTAASEGVRLFMVMIGTVLATAMLTMVVSRAVLGRSVSVAEAWEDARPRLLRLLALTVLVALIVLGALAVGIVLGALLGAAAGGPAAGLFVVLGTLGGLVVVVWLWVLFSLSAPALMLERATVTGALRRSAKLVRGSWWRICGIQLLAALLVMVLSFIISLPASLAASAVGGGSGGLLGDVPETLTWPYLIILAIGAVVTATVTLPFSAGVTALLYIDARIRREALDLELARAAGTTGDTTRQPGPAASES
ncbi:hypothetical protein [Streptomyces sp. JJ38]|uniref:DUF7544 domain-containing protein n=1 Tax=Streptomyces sp. JJ38 TaxID=2738128 RepID=UPI001C592462|nr:hypothetical protein [Streptomyces sp. JJ38]MBW1599921.1 hypothetical protein [Streptomyces sp. JJ38]